MAAVAAAETNLVHVSKTRSFAGGARDYKAWQALAQDVLSKEVQEEAPRTL